MRWYATYKLRVELWCIQQGRQKNNRGGERGEEEGAKESPRHHTGELMMVILKRKEKKVLSKTYTATNHCDLK